ncbi:unnamed protein product [Vitrella brassicaformis CCMP3155]|uniref:Uncharacterized protein n=1 Tax=Vitrella brassicaformis (strain CCMP3155) TaxID=1169540 RepID=A0A0G4EVR1_VITBC|nr:unnamed protein product [Vitrella brassicaformis CCMP3155]|eukprot:CEM02517.1 unnamed protein product [Vitrella brassicaformis CCMP3155]
MAEGGGFTLASDADEDSFPEDLFPFDGPTASHHRPPALLPSDKRKLTPPYDPNEWRKKMLRQGSLANSDSGLLHPPPDTICRQGSSSGASDGGQSSSGITGTTRPSTVHRSGVSVCSDASGSQTQARHLEETVAFLQDHVEELRSRLAMVGEKSSFGGGSGVPMMSEGERGTGLVSALYRDVQFGPALIDSEQPNYPLVIVSEAFCKLCGYEPWDVIGSPYSLMCSDVNDHANQALIRYLDETRASHGVSVANDIVVRALIRRRSGELLCPLLHVSPIFLVGRLYFLIVNITHTDLDPDDEAEHGVISALLRRFYNSGAVHTQLCI